MSESDLRKDYEKQIKKVVRKCRRDAKLQELEKQLEFAESRCGTLKQQLDYIKMLYSRTRDRNIDKQLCIQLDRHPEGFTEWNPPEQNENVINREDGDGPNLMKQMSHSTTMTTISSNKCSRKEANEFKRKTPRAGLKLLKTKKKNCRKIKKRRKLDSVGASSKASNASSQTQTALCQDAVVEIYKNVILNAESESGLDFIGKNKLHKANETFRQLNNEKTTAKNPNEKKAKSCLDLSPRSGTTLDGELQKLFSGVNKFSTEEKKPELQFLKEENAQKAEEFCFEGTKHYCRPTISSKRKQIARDIYSNLNNLNIRHLPFVAARSTAPSHNIGVNIQQVLSIIKKRHPMNENLLNIADNGTQENPVATLLNSRKIGMKANGTASAPVTGISGTWDQKPQNERPRTSLSHWKSNSEISKGTTTVSENMDKGNFDWNLKVEKLKKVLVFLHEDFASLSRKYKRLQKKLTKRNITKADAKDELADIERCLEKKEDEITVVIELYKEVMTLREDLKKLQDKYNLVTSGRNFLMDGFGHSSSAHTQMTSLLRKIQALQTKLKG